MQDKNSITIVCINNNEYTIFTAVMLQSLFANYRGSETIDIYIFHDNLTKFNQNKLSRIAKEHRASMRFILIDKKLLNNLQITDIYTQLQVHYYKLIIPYVLPTDFTKAIFLDSDMIILEDISKLWNVGLDSATLAAVKDSRIRVMSNDQAIRNYKALNIPGDSHYFNTGVMLIDLRRWKEERIAERSLECLENNKDYVHNREQYALNIIFLNIWKELDLRWNQFPETKEAAAYILHYAGWWAKTFDENYKKNLPEEFFYYAKRTSWNKGNIKAEIEKRARVRAVRVFLVKVLRKLKLKK